MIDIIRAAYREGQEAAAWDIRELCCPYEQGSAERAHWMDGYRDEVAQEMIERPVMV